jgi:hypothetical protein
MVSAETRAFAAPNHAYAGNDPVLPGKEQLHHIRDAELGGECAIGGGRRCGSPVEDVTQPGNLPHPGMARMKRIEPAPALNLISVKWVSPSLT